MTTDTTPAAVAERVAHLRHVYGDTCPDAALIETLAFGLNNALKAFSETVAQNTKLNIRLLSAREERDAACKEVERLRGVDAAAHAWWVDRTPKDAAEIALCHVLNNTAPEVVAALTATPAQDCREHSGDTDCSVTAYAALARMKEAGE